ncbi:MAG: alpha/beta fold hydrolase [Polyangiaceae bacterium]|jgi:pimeloyl-ACP methyl ester carboxylesterase|nr:alpha/beta fold hydrolase [Polyangiaceae bacterium]
MTKTGDRVADYPAEHGFEVTWVTAKDGTRLRVLCAGSVDAPRLLCVHGFPQNAAEWRGLAPLVQGRFRVLMVDLRGYACSDIPASGDYTLATLAGDLVSVLEAHETTGGRREPAHLVAHDWGAVVAWALVESRPDLVAHHVSVNGPHYGAYSREMRSNPEQLKSSWYTAFFQIPFIERFLASSGAVAIVRTLRGSSARGTFSDEDVELYAGPLRDPARMRAALGYYRAGFPGAVRALLRGKGATDAPKTEPTQVPTIILWGARDEAIRRGVADRMMREVCPSAELRILPDASHWVPDERPDEVARAVLSGLERTGTHASRE